MELYYFEGDASSVCHLFLGALMYSHPISDNLPTNHPSPPSLVLPSLSLKHWAKLNLYEVYCVCRTNYTKLYKLYERLMVSRWKKQTCLCQYKQEPCQISLQFFFQTPNFHLTRNHFFPNYFPLAKTNMMHKNANNYTVTTIIPKKIVVK